MKKIMCLVLSLLMLLSTMPVAFAQETAVDNEVEKIINEISNSIDFEVSDRALSILSEQNTYSVATMSVEETNETITSGNFTYKVDENGEAVIVSIDSSLVGSVTVPANLDGLVVATIEENAFAECSGLTGIEFEEGIKTIKSKMSKLKNLEYVIIPASVNCKNMLLPLSPVEVKVGDNTIVRWSDSTENTTLYIASTVTEIEEILESYSCYWLTLENIILDDNNTAFEVVDGALYNSGVTTLYLYPIASKATSYVMPDTVLYTYDTIKYFDMLYYAYNLKEITIGKNYNIGFENIEDYHEFWNEWSDSLEAALYYLPNLLLGLGDGSSHTGLFPYNGNLEAIYVSPGHEYLTSKDGVLCLKNDVYDVVLVYPGSKPGEIKLGENNIVYQYAFLSLQEGHDFVITDGFADTLLGIATEIIDYRIENSETEYTEEEYLRAIENQYTEFFNQLFTSVYVSKFIVSETSEKFSVDQYGVLFNKDKTEIIKFPVASDLEFYIMPAGVTYTTNVFLGFSPLSFKLYYPENLTIHLDGWTFDTAAMPVCKTVCTNISPDTLYTTTDAETGEEIAMTYQELFDTYNAGILSIKNQIDEIMAEAKIMLENGEITELEYETSKGLYSMFLGAWVPEVAFCEGHEVIEPEVPDEPEEPKEPTPDEHEHIFGEKDEKCSVCGFDRTKDCDCNCHKKGIANFFFKIILFFQKIFRVNKTCDCGIAHY